MAARSVATGYTLYVGNLPWTVAQQQLRAYFSQFGHVSKASVLFDKSTGMSKGFGFVTFLHERSMTAINRQTKHVLEGYTMLIRRADHDQNAE